MQTSAFEIADGHPGPVPLVIGLEGVLIRTDPLIEAAFAELGRSPTNIARLVTACIRGRATLEAHIGSASQVDVAHLPFDSRIIDMIREERATGRLVFLISTNSDRYVSAVAAHLQLFNGWFAPSADGSSARDDLVKTFGVRGFDYVGNSASDLDIWPQARQRIAVDPSRAVGNKLRELDRDAIVLPRSGSSLGHWVRSLRIHQWAKNLLVFVPLVTSHKFDLSSIAESLAAFVAFSLAASSIYLVNDLVDLDADRAHRTKKDRPLAAGTISALHAMIAAPLLSAVAILIAFVVSLWFGTVLLGYLALTSLYTFVLKRKMIVDVVALATLYTLRVIGGAAAISVPISEWLLAFSMFIFVCLALVKRYTELAGRLDANLPDLTNRNYRKSDLSIVAALAAASGFNAVTVFTLYISSETTRSLYARPGFLWLVCPILMYWIGRILMLAHRRLVNDDPVVFAVKDRVSMFAGLLIGLVLLAATV